MTRRVLAGLLVSAAVLLAYVDGRTARPVEARCADQLGIRWDREQGATERLAAFSACVTEGGR